MSFQVGDHVGFKRCVEQYGKVVARSTKNGYLKLTIEFEDEDLINIHFNEMIT